MQFSMISNTILYVVLLIMIIFKKAETADLNTDRLVIFRDY